ncbi:MAG TPA: heavy metal-associated domain-containing protein [archaeon]|nr:heavy metal-associated domain-containing protein [archaeon]
MEKTIKVSGMHCKSCEILLEDSISEIKGARVISADHKSGTIKVVLEKESIFVDVKKAVEKEGYKVV